MLTGGVAHYLLVVSITSLLSHNLLAVKWKLTAHVSQGVQLHKCTVFIHQRTSVPENALRGWSLKARSTSNFTFVLINLVCTHSIPFSSESCE